jgi:hypothetical protein
MKKKSARNTKISKYIKIVNESIEGYHQGYVHRDHRSKAERTGKTKYLNFKKDKVKEIRELELYEQLKDKINLIGR